MIMNSLYVQQSGQYYAIYTPQGIQIALIFLGQDGQFTKDAIVLGAVTKALAKRWGIKD